MKMTNFQIDIKEDDKMTQEELDAIVTLEDIRQYTKDLQEKVYQKFHNKILTCDMIVHMHCIVKKAMVPLETHGIHHGIKYDSKISEAFVNVTGRVSVNLVPNEINIFVQLNDGTWDGNGEPTGF